MSHGLKLLLIAAGAIITCIVVVVGFQLTKSGKSDTSKAGEQFTTITSDYDDVALSSYDGVTVSGSDVVAFIKDNESLIEDSTVEFAVTVKTLVNKNGVYYSDAAISPTPAPTLQAYSDFSENVKVSNSTGSNYINPKGKFLGSITRNSNGIIIVVTFTQQN